MGRPTYIQELIDCEDITSDINMGGALRALCESSLFRTKAGARLSARVVALCRTHGQQQIRAIDRAEAKVAKMLSAKGGA